MHTPAKSISSIRPHHSVISAWPDQTFIMSVFFKPWPLPKSTAQFSAKIPGILEVSPAPQAAKAPPTTAKAAAPLSGAGVAMVVVTVEVAPLASADVTVVVIVGMMLCLGWTAGRSKPREDEESNT